MIRLRKVKLPVWQIGSLVLSIVARWCPCVCVYLSLVDTSPEIMGRIWKSQFF
jgi:hypothetical protein